MIKDVVHGDRNGAFVAEDDAADGIADEDDWDASLLNEPGGGVIVGGEHGETPALCLPFPKPVDRVACHRSTPLPSGWRQIRREHWWGDAHRSRHAIERGACRPGPKVQAVCSLEEMALFVGSPPLQVDGRGIIHPRQTARQGVIARRLWRSSQPIGVWSSSSCRYRRKRK